ncbi:MAG: IS1634 family transposase [Kiritimatiellaeota bacterium]|nr:IS1634 family transposase [Kiritimatiellota bacterium]
MYFRKKKTGKYEYLQIVEGYRDGSGKVRQKVLLTLGNLQELRHTGKLDSLLESGARFSEKLAMLSAHKAGKSKAVRCSRIGPDAVFGRLWRELGIDAVIRRCVGERRYKFDVERAVYHTVIHRLFESGSDRASLVWSGNFHLPGTEELDLHHLYRAMGFLGEACPNQEHRVKFAPRCNKDEIEELLFDRRRDLFTEVDLVFFDTTSIYFEGEGGETIGQYGNSKDHRPDRKQMVVGVVLDDDGVPLCCEMWPGNVTDVTTISEVVRRFQRCFGIKEVCIVADRGMISKKMTEFLESEESSFSYILGVRMRNVKLVGEEVLSKAGRYHEVEAAGGRKSPLKVKEAVVEGRRYVICLNEAQARKDAHDRNAIVEALRNKLKQGDKSLVGNKGFRKYVKTSGARRFSINEDKIREEARFDGKWVLTTDREDLSSGEVAAQYKLLWMVENIFRTMKSGLDTRPIYHKVDETIRGHVFCSFLAILLRRELERRLEKRGFDLEWYEILHDIAAVEEVTAEISGKRIIFRSELKGCAGKVFQAAGAAIPPTVRFVE